MALPFLAFPAALVAAMVLAVTLSPAPSSADAASRVAAPAEAGYAYRAGDAEAAHE